MAYGTPAHLGRFQAHAPYFSQESLDSRRGRSIDSYAELLRNNQPALPDPTAIDVRGYTLPADDETDFDSGDGSFHSGGVEPVDSSW